jgi:ActR/RegA family two-component response regulator
VHNAERQHLLLCRHYITNHVYHPSQTFVFPDDNLQPNITFDLAKPMTRPQVLLFDRSALSRGRMQLALEAGNVVVHSSASVYDGLWFIATAYIDGLIIDLETERIEELRRLVAAVRVFQSGALVVAVNESLNAERVETTVQLGVDYIVKSSNLKQVAEFLYSVRGTEKDTSPRRRHMVRKSVKGGRVKDELQISIAPHGG